MTADLRLQFCSTWQDLGIFEKSQHGNGRAS